MKFKTTKREIMERFPTVISVNFCKLQNLLALEEPIAYTTTREGWGADVYAINGFCIVTGYSPFGNYKSKRETDIKYDKAAYAVMHGLTDYHEQKEALYSLIMDYIRETTNTNKEVN